MLLESFVIAVLALEPRKQKKPKQIKDRWRKNSKHCFGCFLVLTKWFLLGWKALSILSKILESRVPKGGKSSTYIIGKLCTIDKIRKVLTY